MLRKLNQSDFKPMPWKNGMGVTTELYRIDIESEMAFRVSNARVDQSGPFSDFTGYDRTILNLGPGHMSLFIGEQEERQLAPLEIFHFEGEQKVHCELSSPSEDLNVFCHRDKFFASTVVRQLQKPEFIPLLPGSGWFLLVVSGSMLAQCPGGQELMIGPREALLQEVGSISHQDRLMLSNASEDGCVLIAISFRKK